MMVFRKLAVLLSVLAWLVACAPGSAGPRRAAPAPLPPTENTPIQITPPARPVERDVTVREGSFVRSHLTPRGVVENFAEVLGTAKVFRSVLSTAPTGKGWEIELAGSDYGEPDAYTLELEALLLRDRTILATYSTKQSMRQPPGSRKALTIGPEQLGQLTERAMQDIVRQIATDSERIRSF